MVMDLLITIVVCWKVVAGVVALGNGFVCAVVGDVVGVVCCSCQLHEYNVVGAGDALNNRCFVVVENVVVVVDNVGNLVGGVDVVLWALCIHLRVDRI